MMFERRSNLSKAELKAGDHPIEVAKEVAKKVKPPRI
jgi:hypothetical protein